MSDRVALDATLSAWRERWPEWSAAEIFVPVSQREAAMAWFALLDEWVQAAWSGADPTPGQAKLAWWQEELRGWAKGLRRHPLGLALQKQPTDWAAVATALQALRECGNAEHRDVLTPLAPFLQSIAATEHILFGGATPADRSRLLQTLRIQAGQTPQPMGITARSGALPRRVFDALAAERLAAPRDGDHIRVSRLRTLLRAWSAARGQ